MRAIAAASLLALATGGCGATAVRAGQPDPVNVASMPPTPRGAPPNPELKSFRENLTRANDDADRAGWVVKETIEIPDHHVAVVIYDPKPERAPATRVAKVQVVGAGAYEVVSAESGTIDLMKSKQGSPIWDLRGDRSSSLVLHLTPCGAYCGVAKPLVIDIADDKPKAQPNAPACPTCIHDENGDGVPEFDVRLAELRVAPCSRVSCGPSGALLVDVRGLQVWDGATYARDLRELSPAYERRLARARRDAERLRKAKGKSRICPLNPLQVAARLYVWSRLGGESKLDALLRADEVMRGYRFDRCSKEYDLLAPPRDWPALRKEMEAWELPRLDRDAKR